MCSKHAAEYFKSLQNDCILCFHAADFFYINSVRYMKKYCLIMQHDISMLVLFALKNIFCVNVWENMVCDCSKVWRISCVTKFESICYVPKFGKNCKCLNEYTSFQSLKEYAACTSLKEYAACQIWKKTFLAKVWKNALRVKVSDKIIF